MHINSSKKSNKILKPRKNTFFTNTNLPLIKLLTTINSMSRKMCWALVLESTRLSS